MRNHFSFSFFVSVVCSINILAQPDTVRVLSDGMLGKGNLNQAVKAVLDSGNLSNTVFLLELNGRYILTDSILVPPNEHLTIISPEPGQTQETSPPQILCDSVIGEWGWYNSAVKMMIYCYGDITLKNIWLLSNYANGWPGNANLQIAHNPETINQQLGNFENVIFDYSGTPWNASGAVGITTKHFKGTFKNCYWKNCTDMHFRYYGRAVSYPYEFGTPSDWHIDSLVFENCTFANIGYVYMQENAHYADYVKFNHCTFLNVVMFTLESGWWNTLSVTNSIWVNGFMYGSISAMDSYFGNSPIGGTMWIDSISSFGFQVPFTEQDRRILFTNSSYYIENWLADWMYNNPGSISYRDHNQEDDIPVPQPMLNSKTKRFFDSTENGIKVFPFMNRASLYDSTNPGFILPPTDTTKIKEFLYHKWWDSADENWAWKPGNSINRLWPLEENLAYTNTELQTAGIGGFPLGDLYRWWPDKYKLWKMQSEAENDTINKWLNYGFNFAVNVEEHPVKPEKFELYQNYPNPFNPITTIKYEVPVDGIVVLKIYSILGEELEILIDEYKSVGYHEIKFDGERYSSGIYFYSLTVFSNSKQIFANTKKMVFMK